MKTAGREKPNRWAILSSIRAPGAGGQNRSCSIQWAAKQEKIQPMRECFSLTSSFIALAAPAGWLSEPETPAEIGDRELT
jgi:hypothetical protein